MLGSVAKAGRVLSLFDAGSPERGVSEVAAALGIAKSSAHALLVPLGEVGLVRRLADGRYRLGRRILELSRTSSTALTSSGPSTSGRPCPRCAASRHRSATGGETPRAAVGPALPAARFTTNLEQVRTTVRSVADVISRIRRPNPRLATVG